MLPFLPNVYLDPLLSQGLASPGSYRLRGWAYPDLSIPKLKIDIILKLTKSCRSYQCLCKHLTPTVINIAIGLKTPFAIAAQQIWVLPVKRVSISQPFHPQIENWYHSQANQMLPFLPIPMQTPYSHRDQYRHWLENTIGHSCATNLGHIGRGGGHILTFLSPKWKLISFSN